MALKHQKKPAPRTGAPVEEHEKHVQEFLAKEEHKHKPEKLEDTSEEAKP